MDPKLLTESDIDTLTGDDLARAVAWWVDVDDLLVQFNDEHLPYLLPKSMKVRRLGADFHITIGVHEVRFELPRLANGQANCNRQDAERYVWDTRAGQPWQSDMEAVVLAPRHKKAKPLTADYALSMFGEGMPLHWSRTSIHPPQERTISPQWALIGNGTLAPAFTCGPDFATAVFRAACKVMLRRATEPKPPTPDAAD